MALVDMIPPRVSIVMPSYNRADLIAETFESLCIQTMPNWECVVVDDGSTDESFGLITDYSLRDPRIRPMQRDRAPKGACTCRNIAVEHARGQYLLFLDTDDLLAPFCLEQRVKVLDQDSTLDFAVFPMLLFRDDPSTADRLWNIETADDDLIRVLHLDPVCQATGTLWRKESFIRVGLWSEELLIWQDIELHLRAFSGGYNYFKRFDLRADVYLRETNSSLSRSGYYARPKLESRASVVRGAVDLLRSRGREQLIPEVRYLCGTVVLEAVKSGNLDLARDLRSWGTNEGVLTRDEAVRLKLAEACHASRLDRLPVVRTVRDHLVRGFDAPRTLGQVRYDRAAAQISGGESPRPV